MRPKPEISPLRPSTSLWSKKASRSCNQRNKAMDTEQMSRNWGQRVEEHSLALLCAYTEENGPKRSSAACLPAGRFGENLSKPRSDGGLAMEIMDLRRPR